MEYKDDELFEYSVSDYDIGQESEEDITLIDKDSFSQAVIWGTDWTTETIFNQLKRGNIELYPKFQRRDAWSLERKSRFIESIILGLPIPQIILAERKDKKGSFIVIDGKQRLLSIRQFCSLPNESDFNVLSLKKLKVLKELETKSYQDLVNEPEFNNYRDSFDNQPIRTTVIRNWPNEGFLYTVFLRLNTGSLPLSPQELRQALHPGPFLDYVDEFSSNSIGIKKILRLKEPDYRMRDVEIAIRYFAFKNYLTCYSGNLKDFLDDTSKRLNSDWNNASAMVRLQGEQLEEAISLCIEIFGEREAFSKWRNGEFQKRFNRAIFDCMVYYFSEPELRDKATSMKSELRDKFIQISEDDNEFVRSVESTTKDLNYTVKRLSTWALALNNVLNVSIPIPAMENGKIVLK